MVREYKVINATYDEFHFQVALSLAEGWQPQGGVAIVREYLTCLLYTSPSPRDRQRSRMPSSA